MRSPCCRNVLQKISNEIRLGTVPFRGYSCLLTAGAYVVGHKVQDNTFSLISAPGGRCPSV